MPNDDSKKKKNEETEQPKPAEAGAHEPTVEMAKPKADSKSEAKPTAATAVPNPDNPDKKTATEKKPEVKEAKPDQHKLEPAKEEKQVLAKKADPETKPQVKEPKDEKPKEPEKAEAKPAVVAKKTEEKKAVETAVTKTMDDQPKEVKQKEVVKEVPAKIADAIPAKPASEPPAKEVVAEPKSPPVEETKAPNRTEVAAEETSGAWTLAERFGYHRDDDLSRSQVIRSIQGVLARKETLPTRDDLLIAAQELQKVSPYNFDSWRLHAEILLSALRQLETRHMQPDPSFRLMTVPLKEDDIRDAAEAALRECAHFADSQEKRIALVDEANRVRRVTLF